MKKRLLCLLLTLAMTAGLLAACGTGTAPASGAEEDAAPETGTPVETEDAAQAEEDAEEMAEPAEDVSGGEEAEAAPNEDAGAAVDAAIAEEVAEATMEEGTELELTDLEGMAYGVEPDVDLGPLLDNGVPLAAAPVQLASPPVASGTSVEKNTAAVIDYSNTADGYVMVSWIGGGTPKLKALVKGPSGTTYQYNLRTDGSYDTFPLSDGNGKYTVGVYKNTSGTQYTTVLGKAMDVTLKDEFAPFIRTNQYVNYTANSEAAKKAAELTKGLTENLQKVDKVYNFVIANLTYDKEKAATVQSGYLPDVDKTLATKKGICFDYAALMCAMLRSQDVPVKLVVGYAGTAYHAWISVWSEKDGWIEGKIYFDGKQWKRMDPTFASSSKSSESVMKYIGDGSNYVSKYLY